MKTDSLCLDQLIAACGSTSLVILASDSPLGDAFAVSLGVDIASDERQGVLIFNLDRFRRGLVSRISRLRLDHGREVAGPTGLEDKEGGTLEPLLAPSALALTLVDDGSVSSLEEIRAKVRQLEARSGAFRLLIVVGLESLWHRGERDEEEAGRILNRLRTLSSELGLTVLAVVPLSARSAKRGSTGSSAMTMLAFQEADLAFLFQGEEVYDWHTTVRRLADITLVKPTRDKAQSRRLGVSDNLRFSHLPAAS
jgi:replicative DNA helicase